MAGAANQDSIPELLKQIWHDEIEDYQYENSPFYGMVDKDASWDGEAQIVTAHIGGMPGRATNFDAALRNRGPTKKKKMTIETSDNFAAWSVDNKFITLTRNKKGALVQALTEETEKAQLKFKHSMCWMLWRNGGGAIGQIASGGISSATITLVNPDDVRNFDLDDPITFADDDGIAGGGERDGGAALIVEEIDEDAGTITFDANVSTVSGAVVLDYLFHDGDYGTAWKGVAAYVPLDEPGTGSEPASLWGCDRTAFPTRLAGHRFTGSQQQILEEINLALTKASRRKCDVTHLFMPPETFSDLSMSLEGQRRYADEKVGKVGFSGIEFVGHGGKTVKCFPDADIPLSPNGNRLVYGLNLSKWVLHTAEECPMWLTADGEKRFMTEENANARQGRIGGYGQLYVRSLAVGHNFVLELS